MKFKILPLNYNEQIQSKLKMLSLVRYITGVRVSIKSYLFKKQSWSKMYSFKDFLSTKDLTSSFIN